MEKEIKRKCLEFIAGYFQLMAVVEGSPNSTILGKGKNKSPSFDNRGFFICMK